MSLWEAGEIARRIAAARDLLRCCTLCPRECRIDRIEEELGACGIGPDPVIASYGAHFGEESVLVGRYGSGTVFLAGCNLKCVFCQNYDISSLRRGRKVSAADFADMMLDLQNQGCHNINFVTPTHQIPQILAGLEIAAGMGLRLPLVYNSGGYESVEALRILDGVFDIYMPDVKYGHNAPGKLYSGVPDYWDRAREAVREMHRQVGDLEIRTTACDEGGTATIAVRGLLVRHLVLPHGKAHTREVVRFLAEEISKDTYINIMGQYRLEYRAASFLEINRRPTNEELREALQEAVAAGLHRFAD